MQLKAINDMLLAIDNYSAGQVNDGLICIRFKNYLPGEPVVDVQLTEKAFLELFSEHEFEKSTLDETFYRLSKKVGVITYVALGYRNNEIFMG